MGQSKRLPDSVSFNLIPALAIILAAQLNINLFVSDFKISVAVVLLPVFSCLLSGFNLPVVTLLCAPGVFLFRSAYHWLTTDSWQGVLTAYGPEMFFYLVYGFFLYGYLRRGSLHKDYTLLLPVLTGIDYLANLAELSFRLGTGVFAMEIQPRLILVALGRSLLTAALLAAFELYGFSLLKKEHAQRYRKLLLLTSKLRGEMVWMQKNASLIEETMNTSYRLYDRLKKEGHDPALADAALTVAKDIHEVKKEYGMILRGISEALDADLDKERMGLREICGILEESLQREAKAAGKEVRLTVELSRDFLVNKPYYTMSILRNLFTNALEAKEDGPVELSLKAKEEGGKWLITISDNCGGVPKEYLSEIFSPGFSTKIDFETGAVSRGLGLPLVLDLVEHELGGRLMVENAGEGAVFSLEIPKQAMEVTG